MCTGTVTSTGDVPEEMSGKLDIEARAVPREHLGLEHQSRDLRRLSRGAVIALATGTLEKALTAAKPHPDVESLLCRLLDDLWRWQSEEKVRGKTDMSREEARALPSTRLYDTYEARLLALADEYSDRGKVYHLIGAMIALFHFTVWP